MKDYTMHIRILYIVHVHAVCQFILSTTIVIRLTLSLRKSQCRKLRNQEGRLPLRIIAMPLGQLDPTHTCTFVRLKSMTRKVL